MEKRSLKNLHLPPRLLDWVTTFYNAMTTLERLALGILVILLITSGVLSAVNYISRHTQLIPQAGGGYHEATIGQPRNINPILASANELDMDIARLVYSGLFRFNNNLELVNDLAANVETAEDQMSYTIRLRDDVTWHDGEPFTANDVVFTIRSIQTPNYGSPLAATFQGVDIEKVDDHTIRFRLPQPYAPFLSSLTVGIAPEHVWSTIEPQNAPLAEQALKPIGTGPFKFSEIATRRKTGNITSLKLVRNEEYYGQKPYLDQVTFTFYSSLEESAQALLTGKADGVGFLSLPLLDEMRNRNVTIHRLLLPQYFAVFFNQQHNQALSEAGVRSALALATDRDQIVTAALRGQGKTLHLPIPPSTLSYEGDFPTPAVDLEAAAQNLSDSGWELRDDNIRYKGDQKLAIKITTTDWPEYIKTAEIIKEQWQKIGVAVELEHLGAGTIQQTVVQPRQYEALLFGEILPAQPDPYTFWHSTQTRSPGLNLALFKNQEVDKLLEEARKATASSVRQEKYQEFQNKILELAPAIILYQPYYLFATTDDIRGVDAKQAALPAGRFNNIEQWHTNVKRVWKDN